MRTQKDYYGQKKYDIVAKQNKNKSYNNSYVGETERQKKI